MTSLGVPGEVVEHTEFTCRFDAANAQSALAGSGIAVPDLAD